VTLLEAMVILKLRRSSILRVQTLSPGCNFLGAVAVCTSAAMGCGVDDVGIRRAPETNGTAGGAQASGSSGGQVDGSVGGMTSVGGAPESVVGGATAAITSGGSTATSGGRDATAAGGAVASGGLGAAIGGFVAKGGAPSNGGTASAGGASSSSGGRLAGGANSTGGAPASGGVLQPVGGSSPAGGSNQAGGASSSSGGKSAGGATSSAGRPPTGGTSSDGGATSPGGTAGSSGAALPAHVCEEPTPWSVPTTSHVVGTGTAASCTASALSSAVTTGGNITFSCGAAPVTIAVSTAIQVSKATVVDGAGLVTLDGGGTSQIFLAGSNSSLSVRNLRFINGKAPNNTEAAGIGGAVSGNWRSKVEVIGCTFEDNSAARGGGAVAVWTGSSLTIVSSRFLRNVAWYGGAVYSLLSPLQVINSEFTDNSTILQTGYGDGGAIGTDGASESPSDSLGGTIQICGTQIRNSKGNGNGGGAYIWMYPPDQAIIDRTTVAGNAVTKNASNQGALGGAMRISNGEIIIKDSSLLSNTADGNGGALYLDCAPTCTITNSTVYGNKTTAWGGAIFSGTTSNKINVNNVTFANNAQQSTQGNAFFGTATWTINNSIFLDNSCANAGTGSHVLQWVTSSKSAGSGPCITGVTAADPMLSAPADNGGPTYTMLPAVGSGALQVGANCETADQRGQARSTAACDLGAVEVP
jgi:hypothetical protein